LAGKKKTNYAELVKPCATSTNIFKIMRVHNRIIPLSLAVMLCG